MQICIIYLPYFNKNTPSYKVTSVSLQDGEAFEIRIDDSDIVPHTYRLHSRETGNGTAEARQLCGGGFSSRARKSASDCDAFQRFQYQNYRLKPCWLSLQVKPKGLHRATY